MTASFSSLLLTSFKVIASLFLQSGIGASVAWVGVIKEQSEVNIRQGKRIKKMHMEEVRFARLPCPAAQPPSRSSTNSQIGEA